MKLLAFFLLLTLSSMPTDKYYVTFVKGDVLLDKTKKPLKVGDVLNPDDKLIFRDKSSKVSCICTGRGRFDINTQSAKIDSKGELLAVLKSSLISSSATYHLSTRSLSFEGNDPATYFTSRETKNHILLIKDEAIPVKSSYKLDGTNFFFIQYTSNGKTITHKVDHNGKALIFSDKLFTTESGTLVEKVSLCYQTNASGTAKSSIIAAFTPVIATKEEIIAQLNLLSKIIGTSNKKKLKAEQTNHLFDNYGKIGEEELARLFGI